MVAVFAGVFIGTVVSHKILNRWMRETTLVALMIGWGFCAYLIYYLGDNLHYIINFNRWDSNYFVFRIIVSSIFLLFSVFLCNEIQKNKSSGRGYLSLLGFCIPAFFFLALSVTEIWHQCLNGQCASINTDMINRAYFSESLLALAIGIMVYFTNDHSNDRSASIPQIFALILACIYPAIDLGFDKAEHFLVGGVSGFLFLICSSRLNSFCRHHGGLGKRENNRVHVPLAVKVSNFFKRRIKSVVLALVILATAGTAAASAFIIPLYFLDDRIVTEEDIENIINNKLPFSGKLINIFSMKRLKISDTKKVTFVLSGESKISRVPMPFTAPMSADIKYSVENAVISVTDIHLGEIIFGDHPYKIAPSTYRVSLYWARSYIKDTFTYRNIYRFNDSIMDRFLVKFITDIEVEDGLIRIKFGEDSP